MNAPPRIEFGAGSQSGFNPGSNFNKSYQPFQ